MSHAISIGLDIGGTKVHGVAVRPDGAIVAEHRLPTEPGPAGVVGVAASVIELLAASGAGIDRESLGAIGVGVPGLVDHERGAVKHGVNLGLGADWFAIGPALAEQLETPVIVENDVNVAALGAQVLTGVDDVAYLSIGTGLSAGLVLDGVLRRGASGAAGEIGHVPVDPEGPRCPCGQRGCLELIASGTALAAVWPAGGEQSPAHALFAAARAGDESARAAQHRFADGVAAAIRQIALSVDPTVVVIGGGVAGLGEPLRVAVCEALRRQATASPFLASLALADRVRLAPLDRPIAALGAAFLGRNRR